ncbi:MAG: ankyrin repeat domain-containing protein [Proteobacteria bacterium]|nr:ankyrin repeat domain-containing protein [Pseudomonadota bacterium]
MNMPNRLLVILLALFVGGHALANANKKAQAYYLAAEDAYSNQQYDSALNGIDKAEALLGKSNAVLEGLRVKVLFELKDYKNAKQALDKFYTYKASAELEKDIAPYLLQVDEALKKNRLEQVQRKLVEVFQGDANPELIKALLDEGVDVNHADKDGNTLLMAAAISLKSGVDAVRTLIAAGADVNQVNNIGATALTLATYKNNAEVVKTLLVANADVNHVIEPGGNTALIIAAWHNSTEVVQTLLDAGANINHTDGNDWTALMVAAAYNDNAEVTRALIAAGADINRQANPGDSTPLMLATKFNNAEVVKALLDAGASIYAVSREDKIAISFTNENVSLAHENAKHKDEVLNVYRQYFPLIAQQEKKQLNQPTQQQLIEQRKQQLEKQSSDKTGSALKGLLK